MAERQIMGKVRGAFLEALAKDVTCPGRRLRVALATDSGDERIDFPVQGCCLDHDYVLRRGPLR